MVDGVPQSVIQSTKPDRLKLILIIEAFVLVIVLGIAAFLFVKRKAPIKTNASISPTSAVKTENKISVPMETKYENPFSEKTQYKNPFKSSNPFDNLK